MCILTGIRTRNAGVSFRRQSIAFLLAVAVSCLCAEGAVAELDPFPLKPPDTSSPRETFRSFITNINLAMQEYANRSDYETRAD